MFRSLETAPEIVTLIWWYAGEKNPKKTQHHSRIVKPLPPPSDLHTGASLCGPEAMLGFRFRKLVVPVGQFIEEGETQTSFAAQSRTETKPTYLRYTCGVF